MGTSRQATVEPGAAALAEALAGAPAEAGGRYWNGARKAQATWATVAAGSPSSAPTSPAASGFAKR